jgi:hypothetical protein
VTRALRIAILALAVGSATAAAAEARQTFLSLEAEAQQAEQAGRLQDAFLLYLRAYRVLPQPAQIEVDVRLRERLYLVARRLQPSPVAPPEAEAHDVRGRELVRAANNRAGLVAAEAELRRAIAAAPWVPELAFNLAVVQEGLKYNKAAAANLKLYLLTNPGDAETVRPKIHQLELARETDRAAALAEDCAFGIAAACTETKRQTDRVVQAEKAAESRQTGHFGFSASFSPKSTVPEESFAKGMMLERGVVPGWTQQAFDIKGTDMKAGLVYGHELGGDVGVFYVRKQLDSISKLDCASTCDYFNIRVTAERPRLEGVALQAWLVPATIGERTEIGLRIALGIAAVLGDATEIDSDFGRPRTAIVRPVSDEISSTGAWHPLLELEGGFGVRVAPGLKLRVSAGVSFPLYTSVTASVRYLVGAK